MPFNRPFSIATRSHYYARIWQSNSMAAESEFGYALPTWGTAEVARTPEGKALLKKYLNEISEGPAFKGSPRSMQFLEYVIWQSAAGKTEDLKERTIGVELF